MNKDFKELLQILNACDVRYLLVGGYALIEYTEPRYTKDLDIWIESNTENASKVLKALAEFGAPTFGTTAEDLAQAGNVLQIGVAPIRIDIITAIDGVDFDEAWLHHQKIDFDGVPAGIISAADLLKNKLATGRERDKEDAKALEFFLTQKKPPAD